MREDIDTVLLFVEVLYYRDENDEIKVKEVDEDDESRMVEQKQDKYSGDSPGANSSTITTANERRG